MEYYVKSVVPMIESNYDNFTMVEKTIADFFIQNRKKMDFPQNLSLKSSMYRKRHCPVLRKNAVTGVIVNSYISTRKLSLKKRNP